MPYEMARKLAIPKKYDIYNGQKDCINIQKISIKRNVWID